MQEAFSFSTLWFFLFSLLSLSFCVFYQKYVKPKRSSLNSRQLKAKISSVVIFFKCFANMPVKKALTVYVCLILEGILSRTCFLGSHMLWNSSMLSWFNIWGFIANYCMAPSITSWAWVNVNISLLWKTEGNEEHLRMRGKFMLNHRKEYVYTEYTVITMAICNVSCNSRLLS